MLSAEAMAEEEKRPLPSQAGEDDVFSDSGSPTLNRVGAITHMLMYPKLS